MRKFRMIFLLLGMTVAAGNFSFAAAAGESFSGRDKLTYEVSFNGIPSGRIDWQYLGRQTFEGREVDVILIDSDTKILHIMNLQSKEKVFIDSETRLPLKVERDLVFFGKKEVIEENYNQEEGSVDVVWRIPGDKREVFSPGAPIYNILGLLYFFPKHLKLEDGKLFILNLPTAKVKIKMIDDRMVDIAGGERLAYFLKGRGAKKFNLWLDKKDRLALRLEFLLPLGKIIIRRK